MFKKLRRIKLSIIKNKKNSSSCSKHIISIQLSGFRNGLVKAPILLFNTWTMYMTIHFTWDLLLGLIVRKEPLHISSKGFLTIYHEYLTEQKDACLDRARPFVQRYGRWMFCLSPCMQVIGSSFVGRPYHFILLSLYSTIVFLGQSLLSYSGSRSHPYVCHGISIMNIKLMTINLLISRYRNLFIEI